jgi:hypothetical protein
LLAGAVTSAAGPFVNGHGFAADLVANATLGGAAAVAGGGKFANGAITGAFGYLFNAAAGKLIVGTAAAWGVGAAGLELGPLDVPLVIGARWIGGIIGSALEDWIISPSVTDGPNVPCYIQKAVKDDTDQRITGPDGKMHCEYCGDEVTKEAARPNSLQYDHGDPWSTGGGRGADNIFGACRTCNLGKSDTPFANWLRKIWGL